MKYDSKVVSFQRNASYLHQKALKNRRAGSRVDALELLRQAVNKEPDNAAYALDMADLCSEMGLIDQSNRLLTRVMARGDAAPECLYSMAMNLYRQGEISRAERVLRAYIDQPQQGERAAEASKLLDEILIARDSGRPADRKLWRAMRIVNQACEAMRAGDHALGERLFARAIRARDYAAEVHALLALAHLTLGKKDEARAEVDKSVQMAEAHPERGGVKALCVSAQVLGYLGEAEKAREMMQKTFSMEGDESEARLRVNALCEMNLHAEATQWIDRLLKDCPYDKALLHSASVAAYNAGKPLEEVLRGWQRISRLEPEDPVCEYYLGAFARGEMPARPMDYAFALPREEMIARVKYLSERISAGEDALNAAWDTDARFHSILEWELTQASERLARSALTILAGVNRPGARAMLRVYAERPDAPISTRMFAVSLMRALNIPEDDALRERFLAAGMPSEEEALGGLSVGQRQMIRYAAEYVEDTYEDYPVADIALLWRAFLEKRSGACDPVRRTEAGSAALAMCYLNLRGHSDDIFTVSRWYGCPPRQAAHLARLIRAAVQENDQTE